MLVSDSKGCFKPNLIGHFSKHCNFVTELKDFMYKNSLKTLNNLLAIQKNQPYFPRLFVRTAINFAVELHQYIHQYMLLEFQFFQIKRIH
jgi:hypothetical protein